MKDQQQIVAGSECPNQWTAHSFSGKLQQGKLNFDHTACDRAWLHCANSIPELFAMNRMKSCLNCRIRLFSLGAFMNPESIADAMSVVLILA